MEMQHLENRWASEHRYWDEWRMSQFSISPGPPTATPSPFSIMPQPPVNADPSFLVAHQQAMLIAKQTYQMSVAQQAVNDEWDRGPYTWRWWLPSFDLWWHPFRSCYIFPPSPLPYPHIRSLPTFPYLVSRALPLMQHTLIMAFRYFFTPI